MKNIFLFPNQNQKKRSSQNVSFYNLYYFQRFSADKNKQKKRNLDRKYHSENEWYSRCRNCNENYIDKIKYRGTSEPLNRTNNFTSGKKYTENFYNKWPARTIRGKFSENKCKCGRLRNAVNPIIQLAHYIDRLIQDIEEIN